jgi:phosphoglycolate phosphatase
MKIAAIFFDLDGTLVDSAAGVALALNTALAEAELPSFELGTVRSWIGDGPDALILRALEASRLRDVDLPSLAARLRQRFDAATLATPSGSASSTASTRGRRTRHEPPAGRGHEQADVARTRGAAEAGLLRSSRQCTAPTCRSNASRRRCCCARPPPARRGAGRVLMVGDGAVDIAAALARRLPRRLGRWGYGQARRTPADVWRLATPHELLRDWRCRVGADNESLTRGDRPCPPEESPRSPSS